MKRMKWLFVGLVNLFLVGCPHPPPPVPIPNPDAMLDAARPTPVADMGKIPACDINVTETPEGVCDSLFTKSGCAKDTGCACVVCTGGSGCIDHSVEVYCTNGPCALDNNCFRVSDPATGGGAAGVKKRLQMKAAPKPSAPKSEAVMPKMDLTPGATDPHVTQANIKTTICVPGYTKTVRPRVSITNKIKTQTLAAYGITVAAPGDYELDHLISLELGGAPADMKNLWPEPWEARGSKIAKPGTGAETKDKVETWLHRQVCAGKMTLAEAQRQEATNWYAVYQAMPAAKP